MVEIMLGDSLPWFFPLLALLLCTWLAFASIEKRANEGENSVSKFVVPVLRWGPPIMLGWLFLHRLIAIFSLDKSHMEVLQYLPSEAGMGDQFTLLLAGQGGIELATCAAAIFAVCSPRLPSVQAMSTEASAAVQHRMMMFCALCILMGVGVLFPEHAYIASSPLPQQNIGSAPAISNALLPLLFGLMVMFGGELFAVSSVYTIEADFSALAKKATLKCVLLIMATLAWLTSGPDAWIAWQQDSTDSNAALALLMVMHATVVLTAVLQPSRRIESRLAHGERRSVALLAMFASVGLIMLISACTLLNNSSNFATTAGANLFGLWLTSSVLGAMLLVQFMPTLGFDAAPRPETWWLRMMGLLIPMVAIAITPFGIYLLPGVWLALAWSMVIPWIAEADVATPSVAFVTAPLFGATVVALALPFMASQVFLAAMFLATPALIVAVAGMLIHKPSALQTTS